MPESFDNTIHGECNQLQVEAQAEGHCIVDLVVGGASIRVERKMSFVPSDTNGCCGNYFVEVNHAGEIDLRGALDGGVSGDSSVDAALAD
jgi:hypothetical protein